ncbi:uncharacterized protein LOC144174968 isoform X1 [Haemaphysalis longicornis]
MKHSCIHGYCGPFKAISCRTSARAGADGDRRDPGRGDTAERRCAVTGRRRRPALLLLFQRFLPAAGVQQRQPREQRQLRERARERLPGHAQPHGGVHVGGAHLLPREGAPPLLPPPHGRRVASPGGGGDQRARPLPARAADSQHNVQDGIVSNSAWEKRHSSLQHFGWHEGRDKTCNGSWVSVHLLPAIMQICAYIIAYIHMHSRENEQFQALMEKVFLELRASEPWSVARKRITGRLHAVYAAGVIWMISSVGSQVLNIYAGGTLNFDWIYVGDDEHFVRYFLLAALVLMMLFHDVVSMVIATSYAIHCQLVLVYLQHMSQAVRERRMAFLQFFRGVEQARKSVKYLNQRQALGVTVQTVWVASRTVVCFFALLGTPWRQWARFLAAWLNVFLWLSLLLIPLIQASRLSSTCNHVREVGLEVMARPFGYSDVLQSELDTFLLFTSSLRMKARLCALPVTKRTVTSLFLLIGLCLFIAVQLDIVNFKP